MKSIIYTLTTDIITSPALFELLHRWQDKREVHMLFRRFIQWNTQI